MGCNSEILKIYYFPNRINYIHNLHHNVHYWSAKLQIHLQQSWGVGNLICSLGKLLQWSNLWFNIFYFSKSLKALHDASILPVNIPTFYWETLKEVWVLLLLSLRQQILHRRGSLLNILPLSIWLTVNYIQLMCILMKILISITNCRLQCHFLTQDEYFIGILL